MPKLTLQILGRRLAEKRKSRGIRDVAKEIGVSPATLSRIERGYVPDIETFGKVCRWMNVDPGEILGVKPKMAGKPKAAVHFKKDQSLQAETAQALAQMILAAQRAMMASEETGE
jgi:transcriptional regulator with XRE-family HTH domain